MSLQDLRSRRAALSQICNSAAVSLASISFAAAPANAAKAPTKPLKDCIVSVERVRQSCQQLQDDIAKGEYGDLKVLVKGLIKNYKLEESLQQAALYTASREQARTLARDSLELFDLMLSYFPERINNTTGQRIKVLDSTQALFVTDALAAASDKLAEFEKALGADAAATVKEVRAELEEEAKQYSQ